MKKVIVKKKIYYYFMQVLFLKKLIPESNKKRLSKIETFKRFFRNIKKPKAFQNGKHFIRICEQIIKWSSNIQQIVCYSKMLLFKILSTTINDVYSLYKFAF